jgi:hypothetical protein
MSSTDNQLISSAFKEVPNLTVPALLVCVVTSLAGTLFVGWHVALLLLLLGLLLRRRLVNRQLIRSVNHPVWTDQPKPLLADMLIMMLWLTQQLLVIYGFTAVFMLFGLALELTTIWLWILGGIVATGWCWLVMLICARNTQYIYGEHQLEIIRLDYHACIPYADISAISVHSGAFLKWPPRFLYPYGVLIAAVRMRDYVIIERKMPAGFMPSFTKQVFVTPTDLAKTVRYLTSKLSV